MKNILFILCLTFGIAACKKPEPTSQLQATESKLLSLTVANKLAKLPMKCIQNPLPYKSGIVIADSTDLAMPQAQHPAFYGCFDWHSAVHGHWSLVYLLKEFPTLEDSPKIRSMLESNLSEEHIQKEIDYFSMNKYTASFERTYGWAWLLKLQEELYTWDDPLARSCYTHLKPLAQLISKKYQEYLPKLVYPIRVGEHTNTSFGLSFAYDYALAVKDEALQNAISDHAIRFFINDKNCPITWEPSGYDFISPCLSEMNLMKKILPKEDFDKWVISFLPSIKNQSLDISPGKINDRTDGKLVHLDGLNFSRAWCIYPLCGRYPELANIADYHLQYSLDQIADGDYSGEHWLASFALYAMKTRQTELHGSE